MQFKKTLLVLVFSLLPQLSLAEGFAITCYSNWNDLNTKLTIVDNGNKESFIMFG